MSAQPAQHADPLDPVRILADLPEEERPFFAGEYRQLVEAARDPAGWEALNRYLRENAVPRRRGEGARLPGESGGRG